MGYGLIMRGVSRIKKNKDRQDEQDKNNLFILSILVFFDFHSPPGLTLSH